MAIAECSPNHLVLKESHPLSKDLYANVFGETSSFPGDNATRLFDVSSITENPPLFRKVIHFLAQRYRDMGDAGPTHVLCVESRGYLLGSPLALELGVPLVLASATKRFPSTFLPEGQGPMVMPKSYSVRNGSISSDSRVLIVDDFIATGRSLVSVLRLMAIVDAKVIEAVAVCNVPSLDGIGAIHKSDGCRFGQTPIFTLMQLKASQETVKEQIAYITLVGMSHM
ncbi:Adenine phosphoribosyltransferase [Trypanosoma cruzi]|uniref:adenine phosphoribosyltransferase n=2 Tax=Trypanosoma cruzi TaxID=5693 RepID=V5B9I1_TRYCR|nr:Adenine phosphoribosyltransferase [Trypanosoma cruzi Dm28c]KAF8278822.1 putative Adenine phosphoribosyltransferase [Trypanosoma cruzi]PBJ73889.1 Adenine phosphoribosyltransferase [Trypanosoma cruzi cruzi]PBJ74018.1 Adenine phosphoribosyltransferase [Trypanosoma cruzi cruzi]PWU99668.1 putative Adenine phosphoribosyltransferase [Trypanosoma cruzi]